MLLNHCVSLPDAPPCAVKKSWPLICAAEWLLYLTGSTWVQGISAWEGWWFYFLPSSSPDQLKMILLLFIQNFILPCLPTTKSLNLTRHIIYFLLTVTNACLRQCAERELILAPFQSLIVGIAWWSEWFMVVEACSLAYLGRLGNKELDLKQNWTVALPQKPILAGLHLLAGPHTPKVATL